MAFLRMKMISSLKQASCADSPFPSLIAAGFLNLGFFFSVFAIPSFNIVPFGVSFGSILSLDRSGGDGIPDRSGGVGDNGGATQRAIRVRSQPRVDTANVESVVTFRLKPDCTDIPDGVVDDRAAVFVEKLSVFPFGPPPLFGPSPPDPPETVLHNN
nr:hypothetical protein Itr_chr14CG28770 [Ipomoea trifida]